jgi:oligopeptidase B
MSTDPDLTQSSVATTPGPGQGAARPAPPAARRIPRERTHHGDTVVDEYAWLAGKDNPETIAYLEAENAYTAAMTAAQAGLREEIFGEIKGRTKETDLSVPVRKGDWWYYTRTVAGKQYAVHCRYTVRPGQATPPRTDDGGPLPGEEILLDGNELAGDAPFFSLGAFGVSPDGRLLAYSTDFAGSERYTLRIKDLVTGELAPDEIPDTHYGCAWSRDGSALFYVTADAAWRPYRVWRHLMGTPAAEDVVVLEESDERYGVSVELTRSEDYLLVTASSKLTSEVWLLDATEPTAAPRVVLPRRQGVEYAVEHQAGPGGPGRAGGPGGPGAPGRLLILHNDGALNFELAAIPLPPPGQEPPPGREPPMGLEPPPGRGPLADPGSLIPVIPHREDTRLLGVDAFADHIVVYFRRDGLTGLRIIGASGGEREISFPEPVYQVSPGANPEYGSHVYRLRYTSLATPDSIYDADAGTGELTLLRRKPVLPLPGRGNYDPGDYEQHREWATAADGTRVPISLICRKGTPRDGSSPCLLYGYGSYEIPADPYFSITRLSLLDRGFVYAVAHVRGGGEMGRRWYDDGKILRKTNTFTDFVACAEHLVSQGWTAERRLIARGGSAGGLLVGAAANLAPHAVGGIVANVPFVDSLTTILDPSLPLTVPEWEEWGNPLHDAQVYAYMKAYSPYENIGDQVYPPILAITSLNDTRVLYHEPAKWIARLRATARGGPFLLKTEMVAGHGGRSGRYDAWREEAMILAWIITTASPSPDPAPPAPDPAAPAPDPT